MSLWTRLIVSIGDGGLGVFQISVSGGIWHTVIEVGRDIVVVGDVFEKNFKRALGRGDSTRF